ncbi:MAG: polysaccharide biosynthesis protein, partial [Candidatus Eremiobacteraeota bacterium]|nr:polysaccharide biosynthesis protein [Candidatus Eremiobacteraeota bacterium]
PQGVDFVLKAFQRMKGGEIFVPRIPSVRVVDLAESMAPKVPFKPVGIRPGEKLHEAMCPRDESHLTLRFKDHYVIRPSIVFTSSVDYTQNAVGEKGEPVEPDFEYNSGTNERFLTVAEIEELNRSTL